MLPLPYPKAALQKKDLPISVETGDGTTLDSPAINKAIETPSAAGGGTVHFPAGNYLSYSIRLKSNISLYLDQGATIIAADTARWFPCRLRQGI
jgi:polygalacturonase